LIATLTAELLSLNTDCADAHYRYRRHFAEPPPIFLQLRFSSPRLPMPRMPPHFEMPDDYDASIIFYGQYFR